MPLLVLLIVIWPNHTLLLEFGFVIDVISHCVSSFFHEFTRVGGYCFVPVDFTIVNWARYPLLFFHYLFSET